MIAATYAAFATGLYLGGYGSHLWLDMLNMRDFDLFRPSPIRVVLPGRTAYRRGLKRAAEPFTHRQGGSELVIEPL